MTYEHQKIEKKWQKIWESKGLYKIQDNVRGKKNFYHLVMFPYPSGDLHIGHWYNFAPADVYARFKRMLGFNVLSPIGFDAFGLPAENAAIKHNIHPKTWTYKNIERMKKQLKSMGNIYDWSRAIITCDKEYYKWTQWLFLQFYKNNLAYRAKAPANWCPSCKTVLANEQVIDGKCERCDSQVIQKEIEQWLLKISAYADDLLKDLDNLDWPETTKIMQRNWIGRSEGVQIEFKTQNSRLRPSLPAGMQGFGGQAKLKIPVFTTRADTLFGCTYLVIAPEHPIIQDWKLEIENWKLVKEYIEESKKKTERERISEIKEKTGIEIKGVKAINPVNNEEIPIFVADYVLAHYGAGAIMAVPAHDQRDFEFAKKYNLPIKMVVCPNWPRAVCPILDKAREEEGYLVDSGKFNGMPSGVAKERIGEWLQQQGKAEKKVYYRLRDWLISRQRYWGAPIPMIFCEKCARLPGGQGWQPAPEKKLPVLLPHVRDFRPTDDGKSPLAKSEKFIKTICPRCKGPAKRETDTMDTFICSSWYFLRYADSRNKTKFASEKKLEAWLPVNIYIGGAEHSVMHLLYSRFFIKALNKMGQVRFSEPFLSLRHQGIILGPDGQKMSKSRGNVVDPDKQVEKYGSDVVRMYLCFMGPYNQGGPWNPNGLVGIYRFLNKVWELHKSRTSTGLRKSDFYGKNLEKLLHQTIKKVTEDIENMRFNTAISALMILVNEINQVASELNHGLIRTLLLLLAPFAPHLAEELWSQIGEKSSVHNQKWPKYNPELIKEDKIQLIIQINGKIRDKIEVPIDISEEQAKESVLQREKVQSWLQGQKIKKTIFVPGKLINIVI